MDLEEERGGDEKENLYLNNNTVHNVASYAQSCYNLTVRKTLWHRSLMI